MLSIYRALLKRQLPAGGQIKNDVAIFGTLYVLELLEPRLFMHAIDADTKTRRRAFGDQPDLSLPGEKETVARRKATLLHRYRDVVGRVNEEVVFTELFQQ